MKNKPAVDLTTMAADINLPADHPIYQGPITSATADFPRLDLSIQEICMELFALRERVRQLEAIQNG